MQPLASPPPRDTKITKQSQARRPAALTGPRHAGALTKPAARPRSPIPAAFL